MASVPEARLLHPQADCLVRRALVAGDGFAGRVADGIADPGRGGADGVRLKTQEAVPVFVQRGADDQAVGAVEAAVKMVLAADKQIGAAAEAAEDGEVPEGGADVLIDGVFDIDPNMKRFGNRSRRKRE